MTDPNGWQLLSAINLGEDMDGSVPSHALEILEGIEESHCKTEFGIVESKLNKLVARTCELNRNGEVSEGDISAE